MCLFENGSVQFELSQLNKKMVGFLCSVLIGWRKECDVICEEDIDVINRNMYKACDVFKSHFPHENEKPNSLSFSIQTFVQQWGKIYICHGSVEIGNMECNSVRSNLL